MGRDCTIGPLMDAARRLSTSEETRLARCESDIQSGMKTFQKVGAALLEIRDARLYRKTHKSFEAYCRERWNFTRMRASQLIDAAEVCENVNNCLQTAPRNEGQARELAKLPDDQQAEVWSEVVEKSGGVENVTAAKVRDAVQGRLDDSEGESEDKDEEPDEEEPPMPIKVEPPGYAEELEDWLRGWLRETPDCTAGMLACFLENIAAKLRLS